MGQRFKAAHVICQKSFERSPLPFPPQVPSTDGDSMLSGSLLVEVVMSWPGIGPLLLEAILARQHAGRPDCVVRVNDARGGLVLYDPGASDPEVLYNPPV